MSAPRSLLVADSFRVRNNPVSGVAEVRGWTRHIDRFSRSVLALNAVGAFESTPARRALDGFLLASTDRIAAFGAGFPRLECWQAERGLSFSLSLRPAPLIELEVSLRTAPGFVLDHPERKGPNISRLSQLNRDLGSEALLLDPEGNAVEGATTSLVWWEPRSTSGTLVARPSTGPNIRVASITESLIVDVAADFAPGTRFDPGAASPEHLVATEVWAVNALHGIRLVTSIDGRPTQSADEKRLDWFKAALNRSWEPLHPASSTER